MTQRRVNLVANVKPFSSTFVGCTTAAVAGVLSAYGLDGQIGQLLGLNCIFTLLESDKHNSDYIIAKTGPWQALLQDSGMTVHRSTALYSNESTWADLQSWLDRDYPVLTMLDAYYLHCSSFYHRHHEPHLTIVTGYDLAEKVVYIADSIGGYQGPVLLDDLLDGMLCNEGMPIGQASIGAWFTLEFPSNNLPLLGDEQIREVLVQQQRINEGDTSAVPEDLREYFMLWKERCQLNKISIGLNNALYLANKIEHTLPTWNEQDRWGYIVNMFDSFHNVLEQRWLHGRFLDQSGSPWNRWSQHYSEAANQWMIARNLCRKAAHRKDTSLLFHIAERIRLAISHEQSAINDMKNIL